MFARIFEYKFNNLEQAKVAANHCSMELGDKIDKFNIEAVINLANVLDEKGETNTALNLIENSIDKNNNDIRIDLMKLKLNLQLL